MSREMTVEELYREFLQSAGICTDTRKAVDGTLFFAIRGERFDGNAFVEEALEKGCRLAVTDRTDLPQHDRTDLPQHDRVVYTASPLALLQQLARHHRRVKSPQLLAITGSNGKTTTKELIAAILSKKFPVLSTRGNLNNHIGVPLTLLELADQQLAVIEMGANHTGEIRTLAEIAEPGLGLITNVGKAHLEGFGSPEGVLRAKGELYEYLAATGGRAFVDGSDPVLMKKAGETGVEQIVIGKRGTLPVACRMVMQHPFLEVEVEMGDARFRVTTGLVGGYNLQNLLFAVSLGYHFGVPAEMVRDAIADYRPANFRSQFIAGKRNRVVLDAYNANPTSMREAIGGMLQYASSPVMLILGDMAEMGDASEREHRDLLHWLGTHSIDRVLLVGKCFSEVCDPASGVLTFREMGDLERWLKSEMPEGYHVLVKGSRIMELERLVPLLTG